MLSLELAFSIQTIIVIKEIISLQGARRSGKSLKIKSLGKMGSGKVFENLGSFEES